MWTIIFSGAGLYFYLRVEKLAILKKNVNLVEIQIQEIIERMPNKEKLLVKNDFLSRELKREKERYYFREDMDTYQFSILIRKLLFSRGLSIKKYQTIEVKDNTFLEFSISGDSLEFTKFLINVSNSSKYWHIPYIYIDARKGDGRVNVVFRITYETINKENH